METLLNITIVMIFGNLALLGVWGIGGIVWFAIGDYFKGRF